VEMCQGIPNIDELRDDKRCKLLVLDDLMDEASKDTTLTTLFTKASHHFNLSVVHLVQNCFYGNLRTARINASYLVLFRSPADKLSVMNLGKQLYPKNAKFFVQVFNDACSRPYSYLFIDLTQQMDDKYRLRTNIMPDEVCFVYLAK